METDLARASDLSVEPADDAGSPDRERAGIQSVEVGFALLQVLARADGPLMLRDLAAAADMSAAKAHRYLVSFQRLELVVQDAASTRYDLGPAALRLGLATLARLDAVKMGRERLPALLAQVGNTLALAVWGNHGPTIVHWLESPLAMPVNLRLGDVMPLLTSATGRCFAAWMAPDPSRARFEPMIRDELKRLQKLPRAPGQTDAPGSLEQAQALLAEVRQRGMARVVDTLLPGIVGFCAPVFDSDRRLVMGIVALGSAVTLDADWGGPVEVPLRLLAAQLSRDLGCPDA